MSEFINELKKEHSILVAMLKEIKNEGIQSESGKRKLLEIKNVLLSHLKK